MARKESIQKRLERVRPPRVQLSYDVEIGNAIESKELPFVTGVIGEFSGQQDADAPLSRFRDRKFITIDTDNFDEVLKGMAPQATFRVKNALNQEGGEFGVSLRFESLHDFTPEAVVLQVEPLRKLVEARQRLSDLRNKMAGNEKLEDLLVLTMSDAASLEQLRLEVGVDKESA